MGLHDHATNGKTYSSPGRLRRKERFEDMIAVPTLNSSAGVFHGDHNLGRFLNESGTYTTMSIFLPHPLTAQELTALKVVAAAPPLHGLPYKIVRRLVDLGFAETVRGGLIATEDGLMRIKLSMNENLRD